MADRDSRHLAPERLAAAAWLAAGVFYLASEGAAALAFSPSYSYARNYISDLGVPACGTAFDGRAVCSPLHLLVNADFLLQGLLFLGATLALSWVLSGLGRFVLVGFAALNCVGNMLIGFYPETATAQIWLLKYHVLGAILAIVFGNATALASIWAFRKLALPRVHAVASVALPLAAALGLVMLSRSRAIGAPIAMPDGGWERLSVYTITSWELLTAACLTARRRTCAGGVVPMSRSRNLASGADDAAERR